MYLWLGEFIISLIAALIAIFFFADAGTFQDLSTNPVDIGSRAFPRLVCVFLFIFFTILIGQPSASPVIVAVFIIFFLYFIIDSKLFELCSNICLLSLQP